MTGGGIWRTSLICGAAGLLFSWQLTVWLTAEPSWRAVLAGWALGVANGLAGLFLQKRSMGSDFERFMRVGVVGNAARFFLFLALLVVLRVRLGNGFEPVAIAAVAGALTYMVGEVWGLMRGG